jgi:hypothetical protein
MQASDAHTEPMALLRELRDNLQAMRERLAESR